MDKKVVELFAGVGGFRVGLNHITEFGEDGLAIENKNWEFVWANQWEPSTKVQPAYNCYRTRFGKSSFHSNVDISKVALTTIPNHSLLVGGFPCQDYSVARSLSGEKGIEGKKGVLFWEIKRILKSKKSKFVLLENVDRLLKSPSKQRGRDFGIMLRTFDDLNYNVEWRVINAAEYGGKQKRRRVFIFAWKRGTSYNKSLKNHNIAELLLQSGLFAQAFPVENDDINFKEIDIRRHEDAVEMTNEFHFPFCNTGCSINGRIFTQQTIPIYENPTPLRDILLETVEDKYYINQQKDAQFGVLKGYKKTERTAPDGSKYYFSEGNMKYPDDLSLPGRTMLTSEGTVNRSTHIVNIDGRNRLITPVEAERLQDFPDNWTNIGMSERQRYFMMGNALVTKIVSRLEPFLSVIIENEPVKAK